MPGLWQRTPGWVKAATGGVVVVASLGGLAQASKDSPEYHAAPTVSTAAPTNSTAASGNPGTTIATPPADSVNATTTPLATAQLGVFAPRRVPEGLVATLALGSATPPSQPYNRDYFGGTWIDENHDGCNTRAEILRKDSLTTAQVDPFGCGIVAGDWVSPYDGVIFTDPGGLDIDHVVSLEDAWNSGAALWDGSTRLGFANDFDNLVAVSAESNRSKGGAGPDNFRPTDQQAWCGYAIVYAESKHRWNLTVTPEQRDSLISLLQSCPE